MKEKLISNWKSPGGWIFTWTVMYFVLSSIDIAMNELDWYPELQFIWIVIMVLPLFNKRLATFFNMKTLQDL